MGALLYIPKVANESAGQAEERNKPSLQALFNKGLKVKERIDRPAFVIVVFDKVNCASENLVRLDGEDFICSAGTLFYKKRTGHEALKELHQAFQPAGDFSELRGHFLVLLQKDGKLYAFIDAAGLQRVYLNESTGLLSTSFLASMKSLEHRVPVQQDVYEYLFVAAAFGLQPLFKGLRLLNSSLVYQLWPSMQTWERVLPFRPVDRTMSTEQRVEVIVNSLLDYWGMLRANFGESLGMGLSGGYDSRLMLALCHQCGIRPYLYTYGSADCDDVVLAKQVAQSKGLAIRHDDKSLEPQASPDEFPALVAAQYHFSDGLGITGSLTNGADLRTRMERTRQARLHMNGAGGEIYRNRQTLPERGIDLHSFVQSAYGGSDFSLCRARFNEREFYEIFASKIRSDLGLTSNYMTRQQVELEYFQFHLKYWFGADNNSNNFLAFSLTPFTEPCLAIPSSGIPIREKHLERFEAALFRRLDPELARLPTASKRTLSEPMPLRMRLRQELQLRLPVRLRPTARRFLRGRNLEPMPYYLGPAYRHAILGAGELAVSDYLDVDRIRDPHLLNRALTLELILRDQF